jgi:cytochrome c oxidase cbb3-type subunit 3
MKKIRNKTLLLTLILTAFNVEISFGATNTELMNIIALGAILTTLVLIVMVCFVLLKTFNTMAAFLLPKEEKLVVQNDPNYELVLEPTKTKLTIWQKLLSLRPMEEEKDILIMHHYDDIQELDNPIPAWFNWMFYGTVVFGVVYMLNYHVFKIGNLQEAEYAIEMTNAAKEKEAYLAVAANLVDESTIKLDNNAAVLASGKALFTQNCVACHSANGQGGVGPNLTDEYWIHGGKITDVFKVIKYGVPEKGMISWEKQLSPKQISDVSNYIKSLKGTNPPNAKEPQGVKEG